MQNRTLVKFLMVAVLVGLLGCGQSGSGSGSASSSGNNSAAPSSAASSPPSKPAEKAAPLPPLVVDAGTTIPVTLDQSLSSKTSNDGDHFDASLAAPVMAGDKVAIPQGAKASGRVTVAKSAGKFRGHAELGLTLDSITVGGKTYAIKASSVAEAGKGRGERTAIGVGGGAGVGAIIGAIAGGGKGAAIGAAAGAGAGTAGAAFTGNRDISLAAETKLNFKLAEPLQISAR
jgi:hypothetical protein